MSFNIGDEVNLPQGHHGILKWIGLIPGRDSEYAGVEVIGPGSQTIGKHSGTFQGKSYFQTSQPNTGLFIPFTQILRANAKSPRPKSSTSSPPHFQSSTPLHSIRTQFSPIKRYNESSSPLSTTSENVGFSVPNVNILQETNDQLKQQLDQEKRKSEQQRREFRLSLDQINFEMKRAVENYEEQLKSMKESYEAKLKQARRSSALVMNSPESELNEQRQALASMQNKLISERQHNEQEIEKLKRQVEKLERAAKSAEELETLAKELGTLEEALRAQSKEADGYKAEVKRLEKELEKMSMKEPKPTKKNTEKLVERPASDVSPRTTLTEDKMDLNVEVEPIPSVPVPKSLSQFDEDTSTIDLAAGRKDWCGLCEREGHSATDCPYV